MEDSVEIDVDAQLTEQFNRKRGRKKKSVTRGSTKKKTETNAEKADASEVAMDTLPSAPADTDDSLQDISVSPFDYSVDNYFRAVDMISSLCREPDFVDSDKHEIKRLSSSVTFLREWRHFNYQPRVIRFASQSEGPQGKDVIGGIKLPQFSSAFVPKQDMNNGTTSSPQSSKDFVMYVGGPVWALDWCPRAHRPDCQVRSEFIAVAAHPPDSLYHKIGAPLTGRGIIQIWCLLNASTCKQLSPLQVNKKAKRNSRKSETTDVKSTQPKKPRGRPRKQPINEAKGSLDCNSQFVQALAIQYPEDSPNYMILDGVPRESCGHIAKECVGRCSKSASQEVSEQNDAMTVSQHSVKKNTRKKEYTCVNNLLLPDPNENKEPTLLNPQTSSSCIQVPLESNEIINNTGSFGTNHDGCSISKDVALPRLVLCLAHNGKVAWDVKWRPSNICDKLAMGYLAVLLGNGALEVWEVPLPRTMKVMYSSHKKEGTDPRFVKLEPVFRCSKLNCGDRQSIPLCVEWSSSSPHDLILAGCHDGVVALWKFSANGSSKETRPLVCFSADTVPIRVVAWAPFESDPESSNVIVTAGHKGLKFWDIRDPFRPLWDFNPVQRVIYSLDWLPDPRCVVISFDDGTLRILSLVKAAYDVPVTGKPFVGTQQQGLHSYYCSPFTIWSIQVSRLTGMVAYCSADGTVLRFQLTTRAVEKDPLRNRAPHYLCGSLLEEESALIVITSLPDIPFPMKKSLNEWGETPRSIRGFLSVSNQEKRAMQQRGKAEMSEYQPLDLCYANDPEIEFESNDTMVSQNSKIPLKTKASKKKKSKFNEASICEGVEARNVSREGDEKGDIGHDIEVFPPKIVAMNRVRWNMNKGSERWLSYGGAGGIVRCQEIEVYDA